MNTLITRPAGHQWPTNSYSGPPVYMHCHFQCANSVIFKTVSPSYEMRMEKKSSSLSRSVLNIRLTSWLARSQSTCENRLFALSYLSVCPYGTTQLPLKWHPSDFIVKIFLLESINHSEFWLKSDQTAGMSHKHLCRLTVLFRSIHVGLKKSSERKLRRKPKHVFYFEPVFPKIVPFRK